MTGDIIIGCIIGFVTYMVIQLVIAIFDEIKKGRRK